MARRSGSGAIAHHLGLLFPGTKVLPGGLVCKPSPTHFVEGAVVEWTSWKGKFFIWSLMSPLWSSFSLPLTYSERLDNSLRFEGIAEAIAEQAAELFREHRAFIDRLTGPETTLERFLAAERITPFTISVIRDVDRGLALALLGQTAAALEVLTTVVDRYVPDRMTPYAHTIVAIQRSLAAGDGDYLAIIADMETRGANALGLVRPTTLPSVA